MNHLSTSPSDNQAIAGAAPAAARVVAVGGTLRPTDGGQVSAPDSGCPQGLIGGQKLQSVSDSAVLLDWLEWTIPVSDGDELRAVVDAWVSLLGGCEVLPVGGMGYSDSARVLDTGRVYWSPGRLTQGVHVRLPSSALGLLPEGLTVSDLLNTVLSMGGRFTRVDVAIDSHDVVMADVGAGIDSDELVTRAVDVTEIKGIRGAAGHTLYIGSRSGRRVTRFYDKAAERGLVDGSIWTRCEVEHKAEYAHRAVLHLIAGGDPLDLIVSAVDFRCGDDSNVSRRERSSWWARWLGGVARRVSFAVQTVEQSIQRVYGWLKAQVAPSLALLAVADSDWRGWVYSLIDEGFERLPDWRRLRAERFRQQGLGLGGVVYRL